MTDAMDLFKASATPDAPEESAIEIFKKQQQAEPYLEMRASRETPTSPLDIFKGDEQAARDRALNLSRMTSKDIDPGRQARALQVAKDRKIPVDAAYAFIDELTHKPAPTYGEMAKAAPFTANLAADPFKGPVVFGDEKPLMEIEQGLTSFLKKRAPPPEPKTVPLLDQVFGPDVTHLTDAAAADEQQQRIAGAITGIGANMAAVDQARADIYWQMTTGGASEIDNPRPAGTVDPATMPGVDASPVVADMISSLNEARQAFDTAMAVRPSLKQWAELANVAADTITSQSLNAIAGLSRWTDVVRSMGPGFIEQVNRYLPNTGDSLDIAAHIYQAFPSADPLDAAGVSGTTKALDEAVQTIHQLFPSDPARQNDMMPKAVGAIASVIPFVLGGWVGKLAGANPATVAGLLGSFSMAGDTAADAQAHGATPFERNVATVIATAMGWTEALPVDNIFDMATKNAGRGFRNFVSETFFDIVKQMGIEGGQEVVQSLPIDLFASQTYDKARDVWGNAGQNFLYGAIAGGPFAALASLARALPEVDRNTKALQQIAAASQASTTVKVAPEVVKEHVADMVKDGKVPAFVSAAVEHVETLFQEVWADVAKPAYETLRKAVDEAKRTGAEVSIPSELIPFIAQLKGFSILTDNIRMPDSLTPNEVRQLHDELKTFVEDQAKAPPAPAVEVSPVLAQMRDQLIAAGQSPEVATTQATLFAATLETMARRAGQDPMDLMRRYNPTVQSTVTAPKPGDVVLEQQTPEFQQWFAGSKVVDGNGQPMVVYHGGSDGSFAPGPVYFTDNADLASEHAKRARGPDNSSTAAVVPAMVAMQNPLVVDAADPASYEPFMANFVSGEKETITKKARELSRRQPMTARAIRAAQEGGYDGVILKGFTDLGKEGTVYVPLSPTQIKSIHNRGTFDPANPNILYQRGRRRPMNILEFIASKGGLRDDNGELKARGLTTANARTRYGNAYRKPGDFTGNTGLFGGEGRRTGKGVSPDEMARKLAEAGYLGPRAENGDIPDVTTDDMYQAIDRQLAGSQVVAAEDQQAQNEIDASAKASIGNDQLALYSDEEQKFILKHGLDTFKRIVAFLEDVGLTWTDWNPVDLNLAAQMIDDGEAPDVAFERAAAIGIEDDYNSLDSDTQSLVPKSTLSDISFDVGVSGEPSIQGAKTAATGQGGAPDGTGPQGRAVPDGNGQEAAKRLGDTKTARGFIQFGPSRDAFRITLTERANLSTFIHESGHFFLEVMQDLVERGEADAQMVADLSALKTWMGLDHKGTGPAKRIGVKEHEQFARGLEAYLMEGKSPSNALREVFAKVKSWMIFVYKKMAGLNVNLSDEVRAVMDRMVASDEAIREARVQVGWRGKPMSQAETGLSEAEYRSYVEAWTKAQDMQSSDADARVMLEAAREIKAAWREEQKKLTDELTAELAKTRGYRAWKLLTEGEGLAEIFPGWKQLKIDPTTIPPEWKKEARGLTGTPEENGRPLDDVAEIMGFPSGEQMLAIISGAKAAARDIPAQVRVKMRDAHGEMNADDLVREAMKAVHNKPTMDVMLTEYRALASKANIKVQGGTFAQVAAAAEEQVQGLTRRELDPSKWRRAELNAARKVGAAVARGEAMEALLQKRRQIYAAAMARASLDAQDRIESIKNYLSKFVTTKRRQQLGKAGDLYLDGIDQILEAVELKDVPLKLLNKRPMLAEIVNAAEAADEPINIPPEILGLGKKNYTQMTLEELEATHDAVANLWHLAKLKNSLRRNQQKIAIDKAMDDVAETAEASLGVRRERDHINPTWRDKAVNFIRWGRSHLKKAEFLAGDLDGKPFGGMLHDTMFQPLADASRDEYRLLKDMASKLRDVFSTMTSEQKTRWSTRRMFMGKIRMGEEIIAAALNMGNAGNLDKLLRGHKWSEAQFRAELDAFMTKEDWDIVQGVWTTVNTLWPHVERVTKLATGLPPPKVLPLPVVTPFGTYEGGYYPIAYDRQLSAKDDARQGANEAKLEAGIWGDKNFLRPSLSNGFTKKRTAYAAPILLSLDVLQKHLTEEIHYITHYEAVSQANRIIAHPTFRKTVYETMGKEFYDRLLPYLTDIANNGARHDKEWSDPILRHLRIGTTIASMGLNVFTAIKQQFGVIQALDAIGFKAWAHGIKMAYLSPDIVANWKFALENSGELEMLIRNFDRDVKQIRDTYLMRPDVKARQWIADHAFMLTSLSQAVVNVATWHGAYAEAIDKGKTQQEAFRAADAVVRQTQGSGGLKDLAQVQRGSEGAKLFTRFYSYLSILYNRLENVYLTAKTPGDIPKAMLRVGINIIIPSIIMVGSKALYAAMTGDDDEDKDVQAYATEIALESLSTMAGTVPGANFIVGNTRGDLSPVMASGRQIYQATASIARWVSEGEAPTRKQAKTIVKAVSVVTHMPISGVWNLIDELTKMAEP